MTNEQKALVERLYGDLPDTMIEGHNVTDYDAVIRQNHQAADTIEAQAREIERLREASHNLVSQAGALRGFETELRIAVGQTNTQCLFDAVKRMDAELEGTSND